MSGWVVEIRSHDPTDGGGDTLYGPFRSETAAERFRDMAARHTPTHGSGWNPTWINVRSVREPSLRSLELDGWTVVESEDVRVEEGED